MARTITKIGDIFSVNIDESNKKYFQLIAFDLTQLNSDVIRAFKKKYSINENPDLTEIIKDEVTFYTHCVTKSGLKLNLWQKVGNNMVVGRIDKIIFRGTSDYGTKVGEEPVKISNNWYVWKINDYAFTKVGKLEGENRNSFIGLVINPIGIVEMIKGNKYLINYPDFE